MKLLSGFIVISCILSLTLSAERQLEKLNRGMVAVPLDDGGYFVSWRLLNTDPSSIGFNLYRTTPSGERTKVNDSPITESTSLTDSHSAAGNVASYQLFSVLNQEESTSLSQVSVWEKPYLDIPIQPLPNYRIGDASVADLDGDGELEIVLHQASNAKDNSHEGITGKPILDAYEMNGTHLWRIDLGINIRDGEHYTQFMVYDLDGDGKAEVACKTADGTVDGTGRIIGDATKDYRVHDRDSKRYGRILDGPEYFTLFNGETGAVLKTVDYVPNRYPIDGWGGKGGNGGNDNYGNRCDRFLACIAYLDGERPSVVMCRGVYGRIVMAAWDWRNGELSQRWIFDSGISYPPFENASPFSGMGGHSLSVGDVDEDGRDEIVYQAMTVDDDGTGLYSTGRRHGDSMHLSDFYPERPGLEMFLITENEDRTVRFQTPGAGVHDARTGEVIWSHSPGVDVGSGMASDIDPRHPGYEAWGGPGGLRNHLGNDIGPAPRYSRWVIWWDGDLLREITGRRDIHKWNWETGTTERIAAIDTSGYLERPSLSGDILGDWREELLVAGPDRQSLRLYTTTIPTQHRITTLIQDPQYRLAIAWQNVVYNKPPHPGFFLGHGMKK